MNKSSQFGLLLVILHFVLWAWVLAVNLAGGTDSGAAWMLLVVVDIPVSLLLLHDWWHVSGAYDWNNTVVPALFFLIMGSVWWYAIGKVAGILVGWMTRRFPRS